MTALICFRGEWQRTGLLDKTELKGSLVSTSGYERQDKTPVCVELAFIERC